MMKQSVWAIMLVAATSIASGAILVGFFARSWWIFELVSHFRVQYLVCIAACAVLYSLMKDYRVGLLVGLFELIVLLAVHPTSNQVLAAPSSRHDGQSFRALLINVHHSNEQYAKVLGLVRSHTPDFVLLIEVDELWIERLQPLSKDYPFRKAMVTPDYEIALLSRVPFRDAQIRKVGKAWPPSIVAEFHAPGGRFTLIGTHPLAPTNQAKARSRDRQLNALARLASSIEGPVVLLGDLNTTPWSPYFKDLLNTSGLVDTRKGFGVQPTWPARIPFFWIPIDHCLVSPSISVYNREVGPNVGSDHYPVMVDFAISQPGANRL